MNPEVESVDPVAVPPVDLSPMGGKTGPETRQSSRTVMTDGLRSGGNVVYVGPNAPFWDEEARSRSLRPAMRGQGRNRRLAPGFKPGYLPDDEFAQMGLPAAGYRVEIPLVWEDRAAQPDHADETSRSLTFRDATEI